MKHLLTMAMVLVGAIPSLFAQAPDSQRPVLLHGDAVVYDGRTLQLDDRHILVDGSLPQATPGSQHAYRDFRTAMAQLPDSATVYLAPHVYWVDNPDSPAVAVGRNGREPFGMVVRAKKLHFIGLTTNARNVVLASQRGQTQGAVGNFTMFDFHVDSLTVENLTMGNYCNVDLDYPLNPGLSRKKRNETITQAHVGYVHGSSLVARNVRFISRLNLNPLNGAAHAYYEDCHFECTDDAMTGNGVYRHCTIDLYGSKPFWSTRGHGALFIDCDFTVKTNNREMFFCKQGGPLTLIDCRYHAPADCYVEWTAYPQPWLRCYQQNFTLNGQPYVIGNRHPGNTVVLHRFAGNEPPFLDINRHEAELMTGQDTLTLRSPGGQWRVQPGFESYVALHPQDDGSLLVIPTNNTDETASFCIESVAADGRQAACQLTVKPALLPPPTLKKKPRIVVRDGLATLDYQLALPTDAAGKTVDWRDESRIEWLRDGVVVSTSHDTPERTYRLTQADAGHRLSATLTPKHQRSLHGEQQEIAMKSAISEKSVYFVYALETDFHDFPCQWQPEVRPGYWTVDGYKPADTAEFPWTFDRQRPMWTYGEGFNGAVGRGLLQAQRGARLMYTPVGDSFGNMALTLEADPTKTAGQGFGSATGQYMDVYLKFDPSTLTGYGLRIIRTTKHAKAVDFLLVAEQDGQTRALTEPVTATCYRTGCTISLNYSDGQLTAEVRTRTPQPEGSTLPHAVRLTAAVPDNHFGGIAIQHTGTCGESTTMLHRLSVKW